MHDLFQSGHDTIIVPQASPSSLPLSGLRIPLVLFFSNTFHMLTVGT